MDFLANASGSILLSNLTTINTIGSGINAGYTTLTATGGTITTPLLQTVHRGYFSATGATLALPSLQLADQCTFSATGGGVITANGTAPAAYSSTPIC